MNPATILMIVMGVGWLGTGVFLLGRTALRVLEARSRERTVQIATCDASIRDLAATVNGAADTEINTANAAAELIPMLKDRAQRAERCKVSPYCRKPQGTADANGAE